MSLTNFDLTIFIISQIVVLNLICGGLIRYLEHNKFNFKIEYLDDIIIVFMMSLIGAIVLSICLMYFGGQNLYEWWKQRRTEEPTQQDNRIISPSGVGLAIQANELRNEVERQRYELDRIYGRNETYEASRDAQRSMAEQQARRAYDTPNSVYQREYAAEWGNSASIWTQPIFLGVEHGISGISSPGDKPQKAEESFQSIRAKDYSGFGAWYKSTVKS